MGAKARWIAVPRRWTMVRAWPVVILSFASQEIAGCHKGAPRPESLFVRRVDGDGKGMQQATGLLWVQGRCARCLPNAQP